MFTAAIVDETYLHLQRRANQLRYVSMVCLLAYFIASRHSDGWALAGLATYCLLTAGIVIYHRRTRKLIKQDRLTIREGKLTTLTLPQEEVIAQYSLTEADRVDVEIRYYDFKSWKELLLADWRGMTNTATITVGYPNKSERFTVVIDSEYQARQLQKAVAPFVAAPTVGIVT